MASKSQTRALTPEELRKQGYLPNQAPALPTDVDVIEPNGEFAPVLNPPPPAPQQKVMEEPVVNEKEVHYQTAPTPFVDAQEPELPEFEPVEAPKRNWQAEIDAARTEGDKLRLLATLARTGEDINAAFAGRKPGGGRSQDMMNLAGVPEKRVREDMALAANQAKGQDDDPFSLGNVTFRQSFKSAFPTFANQLGKSFERLTRAQIEKLFSANQKAEKAYDDRTKTKAKLTFDTFKFDYGAGRDNIKDDQFDRAQTEKERHNRETESTALINATRVTNSSSTVDPNTGRSPIDNRKLADNVQKLSKATVPFVESDTALKRLENLGAQLGMAGITDGIMPKNFPVSLEKRNAIKQLGGALAGQVTQQEAAFSQVAADFAKVVAQLRSGLVVNDAEAAYYDRTFANNAFADPIQLVNALRLFKEYVYRKLSTTQKGFEKMGVPDIDKYQPFDAWKNNGGLTYQDAFYDAIAGRQPTATRPPVQNNQVISTAPAANPGPVTSQRVRVTQKATGKSKVLSREEAEEFRGDPDFELTDI